METERPSTTDAALVGRWFTHNETIVVASRPMGPAGHV
jgi:hypothetical protein